MIDKELLRLLEGMMIADFISWIFVDCVHFKISWSPLIKFKKKRQSGRISCTLPADFLWYDFSS